MMTGYFSAFRSMLYILTGRVSAIKSGNVSVLSKRNHYSLWEKSKSKFNCILLFVCFFLYVNGSGSITSVGEERANLSAAVYQ